VPALRARAGMKVSWVESALHWYAPFIAGVIEKARATELRSIGSLKVTITQGVRFVFAPRGATSVTNGDRMSTVVDVSLPGGAISMFPARSRAIERKPWVWPSWPPQDGLA